MLNLTDFFYITKEIYEEAVQLHFFFRNKQVWLNFELMFDPYN